MAEQFADEYTPPRVQWHCDLCWCDEDTCTCPRCAKCGERTRRLPLCGECRVGECENCSAVIDILRPCCYCERCETCRALIEVCLCFGLDRCPRCHDRVVFCECPETA